MLPSDLTKEVNFRQLVLQPRKLGSQLSFSPEEYKEGCYWLSVAACLGFLVGFLAGVSIGCINEKA